ncbi:MAG: hypothetical protein SVK54_08055 [candidate division WOR-3 bacterium]|nr:hypothetical protein [candidate division WOR-3 bacterium]
MRKVILITIFAISIIAIMGSDLADISVDNKFLYSITDKEYGLENEIIIEKTFDKLNGVTPGFENLISYAPGILSDEISIGVMFDINEFIAAGVVNKIFYENTLTYGVDGIVSLGYESEAIGLSVEDENEFLYNISDNSIEYVNTLTAEKSLAAVNSSELTLYFENEFVYSPDSGDYSDGLLIGPSFFAEPINIYLNYSISLIPQINHGTEGGFVLVF